MSARNTEQTPNGNHSHAGSATPDILDILGSSERQQPMKVESFFRETSPHVFNQSPQKIQNSAIDFFDNLPGSLPVSSIPVSQQESVPYIAKSEALSNMNNGQQTVVSQQYPHQQNKSVATSANQSPVKQQQTFFDNGSVQPVTSAHSSNVFDLNVKTVKDELESRLMKEHQRNDMLDQQLRECVLSLIHI